MEQVEPKYKASVFGRKIIEYGLIGGACILFICLVGMVEAFDERDVIDKLLTLGRAMIAVLNFVVGYVVARKLGSGSVGRSLVSAAVAGLVSGLLTSAFVILLVSVDIRAMFVNASPGLVKILTFSQKSQTTGLLITIGVQIALSLLGAAVYLLPGLFRRMVIVGLITVLLVGMLEELLNVNILSRANVLKPLAKFLFGREGLTLAGAITIFIITAGFNGFWNSRGQAVKTRLAKLPAGQQRALSWGLFGFAAVLLIFFPAITGSYITQIAVTVGLYILMGLGLNIDLGLAGLFDLGFVGFFAIGAYVVALLTSTSSIGLGTVLGGEPGSSYVSFWLAIPVAIVVASMAGVILGIPVLRMRGDYLAIVTLGFAEIIRILVLSDFLRPALGGAQGILNIQNPEIKWLDVVVKDPRHFYYLIIIGCIFIAFVATRLKNARIGRNWMAMREDEDVAEATGINLISTKLLAFGIGSGFAGLSGAIFAAQLGSVFPHSFSMLVSINVLALIIVGGLGSIPGVIIGSLVLVGLPELLREFSEFRLLLYGALLIAMMLVKPEGFWPSEVRRRELREGEPAPEPVASTTETNWEMGETISTT